MNVKGVTRLTERIRQKYGFTDATARERAMRVLEDCPPELAQNIEKWVKRAEAD